MNDEQRARVQKLVDTLRTTKRRQGRGFLAIRQNKQVKFCCLGIACELARDNDVAVERTTRTIVFADRTVYEYNEAFYTLPPTVRDWFGFAGLDPILIDENGNERTASELNDDYKYNFKRIADAFERTYLNDNTNNNN